MDRNTFPGMNLHACKSMLADDIADRIALVGHPAEIDQVVKEVWGTTSRGRSPRTRPRSSTRPHGRAGRPSSRGHGQPLPAHHGPPHEGGNGHQTGRPASNGAAASWHPARCRHPWPPDSHGAKSP